MNNDAEKIARVEEILQTQDLSQNFELVSLALAISDEEDRDLFLLEAVRWLIQNAAWQKAYGAAQMMSEGFEKSEALQAVAEYLVSIGHLEKAFSVFDEAEKVSLSENLSEWQQAELLHKIAKSLRRANAVFKSEEVWEKAVAAAQKGENSNRQDSLDAASVLAEIAEYFAAEENFEKALNIARKIKNVGKKENALRRVSEYSQQTKRVA
jgi:tetratricopeptide (TPR) repeat protein